MSVKKGAIGILGGTFDPVHKGHVSIAESFLKSGIIDELWVLLTPAPPHKPDQQLTDYNLRLRMLETAFEGKNNIVVSDLEKRLKQPSYTVQTLEYLTKKYPEDTFYLCMGEDSAVNFKDWHRWEDILAMSDLLVAHRPSEKGIKLNHEIAGKVHFVEHNPVEMSSTVIRNRAARGESIAHLVPSKVARLINEHQPYNNSDE